jgi:hypothetical protein
MRCKGYVAHFLGRGQMPTDDRRDDRLRVVTGRDRDSGADRHLVLQEINGYVAFKVVGPAPVYLTPRAVSKTIRHLRDLQARAMRGAQWDS